MPQTTDEMAEVTLDNPPGSHLIAPRMPVPTTAVPPDAPVSPPWASYAPKGLIPGAPTDAGSLSRRSLANRPWSTRGRAQYIGLPICEAELTAPGDFTPASYFNTAKEDPHPGGIDLSIRGGFTGTITLQRCFNADCVDENQNPIEEVWLDVEEYTEPVEKVIQNFNYSVKWRLGVKEDATFSAAGEDSDSGEGACIARLSQV